MDFRLFLAVGALALAGAAQLGIAAQAPPPQDMVQSAPPRGPRTPEQVANRLARQLGLTEEQRNRMIPIIAGRQAKMQALRGNPMLRRGQRAREARKIMAESDKQINAILTPAQRKIYADIRQERHDRMVERRQERQQGGAY